MKELREIQFEDFEPYVLNEEKTKDSEEYMDVLVNWIQAGVKTRNGRIYPRALLQREVDKAQKMVKAGAFVSTADHPESGLADIETASHKINKLWLDQKGKGWAEMRILPTTRGKNAMVLIKGEAQIGVSARGFGDVDDKTGEVQDNYSLTGIDLCVVPAYEKGTLDKSNVFESLDFKSSDENIHEDKSNRDLSPKNKTKKDNKMTLEELKKDFPELVQQIEDAKTITLKAEADKEVAGLKEKITTLESEKVALDEKTKTLEGTVAAGVTFMRELITKIGGQEGVLEASESDTGTGSGDSNAELESALAKANVKIKALEDKAAERENTERTAKETAEHQTQLKAKLDEVLGSKGYSAYAELIRKQPDIADSDGKVVIGSVEAVESTVKAAFDRINENRSADVKAAIASDPGEKGRISDPEGSKTEEETKAKLTFAYREAAGAGFKGTFEEWKEKYPNVIKLVIG